MGDIEKIFNDGATKKTIRRGRPRFSKIVKNPVEIWTTSDPEKGANHQHWRKAWLRTQDYRATSGSSGSGLFGLQTKEVFAAEGEKTPKKALKVSVCQSIIFR